MDDKRPTPDTDTTGPTSLDESTINNNPRTCDVITEDEGPETESSRGSPLAVGPETIVNGVGTPLPPPSDAPPPVKNSAWKNKPSANLKKQPRSNVPTQPTLNHSQSQTPHDYGTDATPVPAEIYGENFPALNIKEMDEEHHAIVEKTFRGYYSNLKMTEDVKLRVLRAYAATGRVGFAAKAGDVCAQSIRNHLKEDENFAEAWAMAYDLYKDRLEEEVYSRAVEGQLEPVFGKNGQIGVINKKSERLLELLLKRHFPEFRDKQQIDMNVTGGVLAVGAPMSKDQWMQEAGAARLPQSALKDIDATDVEFHDEQTGEPVLIEKEKPIYTPPEPKNTDDEDVPL